MIRTDRSARARRVAAAVRGFGAPLRTTLLLGGLAIAAWLLGGATASADTFGAPADPAQSAVRGAAEQGATPAADQGGAPAAQARDAVESAAPAEAPAAPDTAAAVPEPDLPEASVPDVGPAPEPPGPSASAVVADAADDAGGKVREAVGGSVGGPEPGGDPAEPAPQRPAPQPEQQRHDPAGDSDDAGSAPRSDDADPGVRTGPTDRFDSAVRHLHDRSAQGADNGSGSDDGAPSSNSPALPAKAQGGGALTMVAGYLPRFTAPHRSVGAAPVRHSESAAVPRLPVADRSFSPD